MGATEIPEIPISGIQLSRRLPLTRIFPSRAPPVAEPMQPDAPHDPAIELVEKRSDVGTLVILAPSPQSRVQLCDQLLSLQRHATPRQRPHSVPEALNRFLRRTGNQPFGVQPAPDHAGRDDDRPGKSESVKFDFLGYVFQPRRAKNRWGKYFVSFLPAMTMRVLVA